ncbi:MAG: class II fructose-bisphosphate aldolase [Pseudolysinimonas sp.]
MTLVGTREIMDAAVAAGTGVGAFNVIHLETAEGLVAGAERAGLPVILQISQNCAAYHGGLDAIAAGTMAVARASSAQVAVHLDHAEDEALADQAIALGFGSIMFDAAHLDYRENVEATRRVARRAHVAGVYIEAELGKVFGKGGAHDPGVRTDSTEAREFVEATGVDALAVAVGSSHAMTERSAFLDTALIGELHDAVPVPLVLHGSSGASDPQLQGAIRAGMTKINVSTHFNGFFTRAIRDYLDEHPAAVDSRSYLAPAREAVMDEAARLLGLFAIRRA